MPTLRRRAAFILLLLIAAFTLFPFLGEALFYSKGEPREAVVAVSILNSGNWILPVSYGDMIPYKPPFMAWCIALLSLPGGEVTEYISRLPSALALAGLLLMTFSFLAHRVGTTRALTAMLVTLTAFEVYRAGMACRVDMILTFFIVGAICRLVDWHDDGLRGAPWVAVLLMTGAFLTKGPVGVLLPCLVAGIYMLLRGTRFLTALFALALCGVASCIIPALWYIAAYARGGEEFMGLVMEENFGRMTGTMTYESHVNPWWYNVVTLVSGFLPWTLAALLALFVARYRRNYPKAAQFPERLRAMNPGSLAALVTIAVVFVFYCIPASKRSVYLLPVYPFLALFVGDMLLWLGRSHKRVVKIYFSVLAVAAVAVTALFVVIQCDAFPYSLVSKGRHALENAMMITSLSLHAAWWKWLLALLPAALGVSGLIILRRMTGPMALASVFTLTLSLYWAFGGTFQPAVLNAKSDLRIAAEINRQQPEGPIYSRTPDDYHTRYYSLNYYTGDRMRRIETAPSDASGIVVMTVDEARTWLPANAGRYDFTLLKHYKARSCDMRAPVLLLRFEPKR